MNAGLGVSGTCTSRSVSDARAVVGGDPPEGRAVAVQRGVPDSPRGKSLARLPAKRPTHQGQEVEELMDPDDLIELFAFLYFFALGLLATGAV